ncbi:GNAT family N-acetyltransferase [Yinghuangia sp. ASG 101]|uniref:GNAT family N-acetyltransferase n=1 Tax=Yinghuangia sp. ASG 101 TaxID=2896848 RepID=UPI001E34BAFE|nr:GNAT family N-acetyltransferase [Yinghuangia sp. ASG 101]UGQ12046.1 GNAT family N-acetyltransferase [Yinghuangia sp. ASG 101]
MPDVSVRSAGAADRPVVERLWLMFRHDLSQFDGVLPDPDGTFHTDRLDVALTDSDWAAYLVSVGVRPAGLAFVRGLGGPKRVLNSFFVVRGARRAGIGLAAAQQVIARHPGPWEVAFQDANAAAVRFWRRVAGEIAGDTWTEERRPVPRRPELPPDVWISFDSPRKTAPRRRPSEGDEQGLGDGWPRSHAPSPE